MTNMKRINILTGTFFLLILLLASCQKDVEVWDSATLDYSGRYVFRILNTDGSVEQDYSGAEFQIYNTAANVANEVWFDDFENFFAFKSKLFLSGSTDAFTSTLTDYDKLPDNQYTFSTVSGDYAYGIGLALPSTAPTATGQSTTEDRFYLRGCISEGKITKNGFTTKGGNQTDGIRFKITLYGGTMTFTSYELPESSWADPNTPEYAWRIVSVDYDSEYTEEYYIEGFRYTGYPEDLY